MEINEIGGISILVMLECDKKKTSAGFLMKVSCVNGWCSDAGKNWIFG